MRQNGINKPHVSLNPRPDVIQFILKDCYVHESEDSTQFVDLDTIVHDFMLYGPSHSNRDPFPSEMDMSKSMEWLQSNGYIFLAGDNGIATHKLDSGHQDRKFSIKLLRDALRKSLSRLSVQHI